MRFHVLTLFPEMIEQGLGTSITGRAMEKGLVSLNAVNIRDYAANKHRKVDDYTYGGGAGMLMQAQPVYDACMAVQNSLEKPARVVYMSPQGKTLCQQRLRELAEHEYICILCGHYEGVDQRLLDAFIDEEISIGDYVLTGGELPAMVFADALCRMVPGVLSNNECFTEESHFSGLLEYPQYTKPAEWRGREVPEVLLSGHHANIARWRAEKSVEVTRQKRPDMLKDTDISTKC